MRRVIDVCRAEALPQASSRPTSGSPPLCAGSAPPTWLEAASASRYDSPVNRDFYQAVLARLLEGEPTLAGRGLDLGCGTGFATELLVRRYPVRYLARRRCRRAHAGPGAAQARPGERGFLRGRRRGSATCRQQHGCRGLQLCLALVRRGRCGRGAPDTETGRLAAREHTLATLCRGHGQSGIGSCAPGQPATVRGQPGSGSQT